MFLGWFTKEKAAVDGEIEQTRFLLKARYSSRLLMTACVVVRRKLRFVERLHEKYVDIIISVPA
jgi:hypothetical protein